MVHGDRRQQDRPHQHVGVLAEFDIPTYYSHPLGIAAGPDGNMWFTENNFPHTEGNKIGRVAISGEFTEFRIPIPKSRRFGITAGPDGNMWFTENAGNKIGRVTTGGTFSEYAVNQIGRVTPSGVFSEFPIPTGDNYAPSGITAGPDGNMWFTEYSPVAPYSDRSKVWGFRMP